MRGRLLIVAFAFATTLGAGCGPMIRLRSEAVVPHPLRGRLVPGEVLVTNQPACNDWNIDTQACTHRAHLVQASAEQVCVEVTLGQGAESPWVDSSRFTLASDTGSADVGQPTGRQDQRAVFPGIEWWYENVPGGGVERRERPRAYPWMFSSRAFCFPNAGVLTPTTSWIELRVTHTGGDNLAFRWAFGGA